MSDQSAILAFEMAKLMEHGLHPASMTDEERIEFIRWNVLACTDELHEALAECGWKPWASSSHINREPFLHELVDAQLFLHNLMLAVVQPGESIDDLQRHIEAIVMERINRAINRQHEGYDGVTHKCPGCHRDLGDVPPVEVEGKMHCAGCGKYLEKSAA